MAELSLNSLNPSFRQGFIRVRVSRLWEYRGGKDDGPLRHIDLVLLDSQGFPMYGEIGQDALGHHRTSMAEGHVYKISRFRVIDAKPTYRPVDSNFMVDITVHTVIEECSDVPLNFPRITYKLTPFSELASHAGENKFFIDVVGMITQVTQIEYVQIQYQPAATMKRTITLRDTHNYEMKLVLWGAKAAEFDPTEICRLSEQKPVVAIFVGLLVKIFKTDICLSANAGSRWYFNLEVPEVTSFLTSLPSEFPPVVVPLAIDAASSAQEPPLEPELKTVKEIVETSPYDFPRQGFRCSVTISKVNENASWYFASCNRCNKSCHPQGSGYKCSSPNCGCTSFKFKYKVSLFGTDGSAEAEFIFFGELGRRLVGKELKAVMRSCSHAGAIPSEIAALVSQKYQLTVNVSSRSFRTAQQSYQVKSIDCAYGKQMSIPPIVTADLATSQQLTVSSQSVLVDKSSDTNIHTSTSAPSLTTTALEPSSAYTLVTTPDAKSSKDQATTPPPHLSPIETPSISEKAEKRDDKTKSAKSKTARTLFKEETAPSMTSEEDKFPVLTDDNNPSDDDIDTDLDAVIQPEIQKQKKGPPAKRAKKA